MSDDWVSNEQSWNLPAAPLLDSRIEEDRAILELSHGALELSLIERGILRLRFARSLPFAARPSRAVLASAASSAPSGMLELDSADPSRLILRAASFQLDMRGADCTFQVRSRDGLSLESAGPILLSRDSMALSIWLGAGESIYGLGEKTGFLDRRGRRYEMWNTDNPVHTPGADPLYQSIPFFIRFDGERALGVFLDSTARSRFDLGFSDPGRLTIESFDDELDLYLIEAGTIAGIISAYARLTGMIPLPPLWALGFGQSRWSYYPASRVLELARAFRERDIPCDSIYLDIDYMDGYRVFTWDRARFPDPQGLCASLRDLGFRVVAIVDPGVKSDARYGMYIEGCRDGRFCKHPDGSVYHGKVWPGISAYPDFSRASTREWWARSHESLLGRGVSGIWCDMNEPSDFSRGGEASADRSLATVPDDLVSSEDGSPRPFALTHNAYGLDMSRAARRAFELLRPGERPFVLTRSGSAGIQRYAAVWTGDNHSWWEHLAQSVPMLLGMGLSGLPFVGADAGGFQGEADGELYVRWMELAALTPFFRAHSALGTRDKEPWSFGPEAEALARKAIRLRYSLLPYIYGEFRRASVEGLPIMRPLVLDCQDDPRARSLCDEYLLGPSLLVAPVLRPGDRERLVYLPKGTWYDFRSGEALEGGRSIIAAAPLGGIPLYAKAGAVIPTAESAASTAAMDLARLTLRAYAGAEGRYELYEDDGSSLGYERGEYSITECRVSKTESGRWSFAWEKLCDHWRGACRSPMIELVGGPWEEAGER